MKHLLRELRKEKGLVVKGTAVNNPVNINVDSRSTTEGLFAVEHQTVVASFFYSARDGERETNHRHMLQTLLFQVLEQESRLYPRFQKTYCRLRDASKDHIIWNYSDLKEAFIALATSHEQPLQIYFLVDALDESDQTQLSEILSLFQDCRGDSTSVIKTVLASRPNGLIEKTLTRSFHLVLEDENKQDIAILVDAKLAFLHDSDTLFKWTAKYLNNHAQGVFLWVSFIIKELMIWAGSRAYTEAEIKNKVHTFPLELVDYYKCITERLAQHEPEVQDEARKMLDWVTYAERPITAGEFWDIIAVPSNLDRSYVKSVRDFQPLKLLRLQYVRNRTQKNCGDLIEIKRQTVFCNDSQRQELDPHDIVQLFHQTVREFLIRPDKIAAPFHIDKANARNTIAIVCARYIRLSLATDDTRIEGSTWPLDAGSWTIDDHTRLVEHLKPQSLLSYALKYLPRYLRSIPRSESLVWQVMRDYFSQTREAIDSYAWNILQEWFESVGFPTEISESSTRFRITSLVAAINHGSLSATQALLETQRTLDYIDRHTNYTAMQTAAALGDHAMADLLISKGATVNFHGGHFGTPLQAAAYHGHGKIVIMLLDHGANPNSKGGFFRTAFLAAACMGHVEVAKNLFDNGADTYCFLDLLGVFADSCQAERMGKQLISTLQVIVGPEHNSTVHAMTNLASMYQSQERWKEAEELQVEAMERTKRVFGIEHPNTLTTMANLASTYWNQGRWKEAEELQVKVMETTKRVLGMKHPHTVNSMANLVLTYQKQECWNKAEELEVEIMETSIQTR